MKNWEQFMLESNRIEGEDRLNPNDEDAFNFARAGIDTLEQILDLHRILGEHLKEDWVGKWRQCDVRVGSYYAPDWGKVPYLMKQYVGELSSLSAHEAHNDFEHIHPFKDLNGRVGRLIWLSKAIHEGYDFEIPFLQKYYYQTLAKGE